MNTEPIALAGGTILVVAGLAGLLLPLLPGAPLLFLGFLLLAWAEDFQHVGTGTLLVLGLLALLTYVADLLAGAIGAQRFGAPPRALAGATLGTLVGILFGLAGVLLGPFIGAVAGALTDRRSLREAGRSGVGATLGLLFGTAAKLALGFAMLGVFALARLL